MKRCLFLLLTLALLFTMAACAAPTVTEPPVPEETLQQEPLPPVEETPVLPNFPGKIAIITNGFDQDEEEYRSGQLMVEKYGADKIIHLYWPGGFMQGDEQTVNTFGRLAGDSDIKALIVNQAVRGTVAGLDRLLETREDIFTVCSYPQDDPAEVAQKANLILRMDEADMGSAMVQQAYNMGAKTFVYYSFPRHMEQPELSAQRDAAEHKCAELGIEFVYAEAPDPTGDMGITGAQQFIQEDVPKMVAQYGADTALFSTNCGIQIPLIKSVVEQKAIYPQPCHPSPYHGFPAALKIEVPYGGLADTDYVISETARILKENDMLGRVSNWPVSSSMMGGVVGTEYAVKWLNGEAPQQGIDIALLKQLIENYAGVECHITTYSESGVEYDNYFCVNMEYLTYSEADIL